MSINVTTSSVNSSSAAQSSSSTQSKNSSTESFKDEFDKVSTEEDKQVSKTEDKKAVETDKKSEKVEDKVEEQTEEKAQTNIVDKNDVKPNQVLEGEVAANNNLASKDLMNMNNILANDIKQMINTNAVNSVKAPEAVKASKVQFGQVNFEASSAISMTQADAEFFINLTKNDTVTAQNVVAQAQTMLDNGAEVNQVKQNVQISEALLNAINKAKETNQPLRIDFDKNVAVILKIGKDGSLAANFIPGDKAVEQYLRNNIETLKATFDEKNLSYTDLSYSNRGSKQQKENRRNKQ